MKRDFGKITADVLDVLVIGGGIHGAAIVYHAAKAGYRTAIVDKNDFCGGTSANSLKILHGGLRYLQHGNVKRMRHSILSRREMMRLFPYLVEPLPCMMPLYGKGLRGKAVMRTALFINDLVSWDRNQDLPEDIVLPQGHTVSKEKCLEVIPGIDAENLHGAAVWYDVLAVDTERMVLEYILEGVGFGADAVNYAEVKAVEYADVYTVTVEDRLHKRSHQIQTRYIVNAAGPWFEKCVVSSAEEMNTGRQQWALALNLISRKNIFAEYAVALEGSGSYQDKDALVKRNKRLYFFVPWRGYTMIGTEYEVSKTGPDHLQVTKETLQNMVNEINAIYPPACLTFEDISFYHAGLLPMRCSADHDGVQLEKNSTFAVHEKKELSRVLSLKSVKYTTAPYIAHEVVEYLKKQVPPADLASQKEHSQKVEGWQALSTDLKGLLEKKYGPRGVRILHYMKDKEKNFWVDEKAHVLKAEVQYLIEEEMASRLSDLIFRRTGLGTAECLPEATLNKIAACMGNILGWDAKRREQEVQEVLHRYSPLVLKSSS